MSKNQTSDFQAVMPSMIRLIAGVIVLLVAQSIALGLPGMNQAIMGSTYTMANLALFSIGLVTAGVVLKFGTQLSNAVADTYKSVKNYTPLLTYLFQVTALWILYTVSKGVTGNIFSSAPWVYPLIFLGLAIVPTLKAVTSVVQAFEGQETHKHPITRDQF